MTRDDIIRMADQAFDESSFTDAEVLRFAALVAAAEREACSDIAEEYSSDGDPDAGTIIAQRIRARGNT